MAQLIDMTGQRFGKLLALRQAGNDPTGGATWICACDCGKETVVRRSALTGGRTRSCGCLYRASRKTISKKHGLHKTSEYKTWIQMKQRCLNPRCKAYKQYGARGISICPEWSASFEQFFHDMGVRFIFDGGPKSLRQISDQTGVPQQTLAYRVCHGWSIERAVHQPVGTHGGKRRMQVARAFQMEEA